MLTSFHGDARFQLFVGVVVGVVLDRFTRIETVARDEFRKQLSARGIALPAEDD